MAGIDAVGPFNLNRSYRVFDGDTGYAMELAAVVGQGVLEGRWKALKLGPGRPSQGGATVSLQAQYASLAEWREIRQQPSPCRVSTTSGVNRSRRVAPS